MFMYDECKYTKLYLHVILQIYRPRKHLRQMHSAVRLNQYIVSKSSHARLVIVNMPTPTNSTGAGGGAAERQQEQRDWNYMNYLETLTEGLPRVLLVRGSGLEVVSPFPRLWTTGNRLKLANFPFDCISYLSRHATQLIFVSLGLCQ